MYCDLFGMITATELEYLESVGRNDVRIGYSSLQTLPCVIKGN
jgi:hypothetical protein